MVRRATAHEPRPAATAREVLRALQEARSDATAQAHRRRGVSLPTYGVSARALAAVVKRAGVSTELAVELWRTGVHDARAVALGVADAPRVTKKQLEAWSDELSDSMLAERLAALVARSAHAIALSSQWTRRRAELVAQAGWIVVARLARARGLARAEALAHVAVVERAYASAPRDVQRAMVAALRSLAESPDGARDEAIGVARALGVRELDDCGGSAPALPGESLASVAAVAERRPSARPAPPTERKSGRRLATDLQRRGTRKPAA